MFIIRNEDTILKCENNKIQQSKIIKSASSKKKKKNSALYYAII